MNEERVQKAYLTRGLPASSKSTWARNFASDAKNVDNVIIDIINNDTIREELNIKIWTPKLEKSVKHKREYLIISSILAGHDIIVDNTHLNPKTLAATKAFIKSYNPNIIIIEKNFLDVPIYECILRDKEREKRGERHVGHEVILKMAHDAGIEWPTREYNNKLASCVLVDLDGTFCEFGNRRSPYDASKCDEIDTINPAIDYILSYIKKDVYVIFMSGRDEKYREPTVRFLKSNGYQYNSLYMRSAGDSRHDYLIKKELFDKHIDKQYNVLFAFDDRPVIKYLWRSLGIRVFDVGPGYWF